MSKIDVNELRKLFSENVKKRKGRNDDLALPILLGTSGAAGLGLSAKQGFDQLQKRKKSRTGGR